MSYFAGKVIWITGASSGIGEALAKSICKQGGKKLILSARNEAELIRVQEACGLSMENCLILPFDLAQTSGIAAITLKAIQKFGAIDILINNGGLSQRAYAKDTPIDIDRRIMEVNYFGTVALTKSVLPYMLQKKSGQIVVISSVAGKFGFFLRSAYSASKHALHGFFESLRMEIYKENISVLLVNPGKISTSISEHALTASGGKHGKAHPEPDKNMPVEECARQIVNAIVSQREEFFVGNVKEAIALRIKRFFPGLFSKMIRKQKPE